MLIKKLPLFTGLSSLILLLSFFYNQQHDEQQWASIQQRYLDKLITIEVPVYLDYLKRKLSVEGKGSEKLITNFQKAIDEEQPLIVIKAILNDAEFFTYMKAKGRLFLESETIDNWQTDRAAIEPFYKALSPQRLGVSPQKFQLKQVLTHVSSHPYSPLFIMALLCFTFISYVFETNFGAFRLYCYLLFAALISSLTYLPLSANNAPVLVGPLGISYGLATPLFVYYLHTIKINKAVSKLPKLPVLLFLFILFGLLSYTLLHSFTLPNSIPYLLSSVLAPTIASSIFMALSLKVAAAETPPKNNSRTSQSTDWEYRAELSKALEFLSRFEFNAARQLLNSLGSQYPESSVILEQRYHLAKLRAEDSLYWQHARSLIKLCVQKNDYERISRLFADIQKNTASKKRAQECLEAEHYHKIMMLFINQGDLAKAEQAFLFLELGSDRHIIQDACHLLIQEFKIRHTHAKQQQYEMLLERLKA